MLMAFIFKTSTSLWLVLASLFLPLLVQPNEQARLYLQHDVTIQDERLLVVNLLLVDVVDLYGADIQLRYDPAQLQVRDENPRLAGGQISPDQLLAFDNRFVVVNKVDTESGLINFAFVLLNPAPPISGQGALATINFEILESGPFSVEIVEAQLISPDLQMIPVTTEDLYLDYSLAPGTEPQRVSNTPLQTWWLAALLGVSIALASVFWLLLRRAGVVALETAPASPRSVPDAPQPSAHFSSLLTGQGNNMLDQDNMQPAYNLFSRAVELDPANAEAWLGKGLVAQQETEKRICFQRVLAIDPDNATAKTELQQLENSAYDLP